jgi:hypothetical protein
LHLPANRAGKCNLVSGMTVLSLYARIWRTYFAWARTLLPLAVVVFVPLGLIHAIPVHVEATSLTLGSGLEIFGYVLALLLLVTTGLLGEVFYTGAVAIALTHPHNGTPPTLREVAGTIRYWTLIAVDLVFGVLVAVGFRLSSSRGSSSSSTSASPPRWWRSSTVECVPRSPAASGSSAAASGWSCWCWCRSRSSATRSPAAPPHLPTPCSATR